MGLKQYCAALVAAMVVAACGGGEERAMVAPADVSKAFASVHAALAAPAVTPYQPQVDEVFRWAEETFPQWFPFNGEAYKGASMPDGETITYRYYPVTGNYLGVSLVKKYVYVLGPISGYSLLYVGSTSDFACQIFPFGCALPNVPVIAPQPGVWPGPAARDPDVHVTLEGPSKVTRYLTEGQHDYYALALPFYVQMTGYFGSYPANTASIRIEDPHQLLGNTGSYELPFDKSLSAFTSLKPPTVGLREGVWKVHVCLSADCSLEAENSPLDLPYRIEVVREKASTNTPSVNVDATFGLIPPPVEVRVNLPPYTNGWNATFVTTPYFDGGWGVATQRKWSNNDGGAVALTFNPATVGSHTSKLNIVVSQRLPGSTTDTYQTLEVPVTYNVAANPSMDYAFERPEVVIVAQAGFINNTAMPNIYPVAAPGVSVQTSGVEYLAGPSNLSLATSWLSLSYGNTYHQCEFIGSDAKPRCLPPGDYTARVRYTMSKGGLQSTIYLPITLKLYP